MSFAAHAAKVPVKIKNETNQLIVQVDYWFGSSTESNGANLNFASKGTLAKSSELAFPVDYKKNKRDTLIIRAYLAGGGFITQKYTISEGEIEPTIMLYNVATPVKNSEFQDVMNKFSILKIQDGNQASTENALNALIGALYVYADSTTIVYKVLPNVLKTQASKTTKPALNRKITGIFSNETAIQGSLSLPFVSASSSFDSGDIAKFTWEIEDVGEYNWFSEEGNDLAVLFSKLPQETKDALLNVYKKYPNATMKFIDKAFVIGRMEVITSKTRKITNNVELNGANYVTASGNYMFIDDLEDKFVIKDVITQVDGYDATVFLTSLNLKTIAEDARNIASNESEDQIKNDYNTLKSIYPEKIEETENIDEMKKTIVKASKVTDFNSFVKRGIKKQRIGLKL